MTTARHALKASALLATTLFSLAGTAIAQTRANDGSDQSAAAVPGQGTWQRTLQARDLQGHAVALE